MKWAVAGNFFINLYTDSLSSILAISSLNNKSSFVHNIKVFLSSHTSCFRIHWVKAHNSVICNEVADQLAKAAVSTGDPVIIPFPRSFFKRSLFLSFINSWYDDLVANSSGDRFFEFFPCRLKRPVLNRFLYFFFSGHGPFPAYLYRFGLWDTYLCTCGGVGDPDHYVFSCALTERFHLSPIIDRAH